MIDTTTYIFGAIKAAKLSKEEEAQRLKVLLVKLIEEVDKQNDFEHKCDEFEHSIY